MAKQRSVLGTGLRYFLTVLAGMTLSMIIAYGLVRALTKDTVRASPASTAAVERGWDLRACANELTRLANAFTDAVPTPATPLAPGTTRWLRSDFQSEIAALQRQLSDEHLLNQPPAQALLDVCGRLVALANHPDDAALRGAVFTDIHRALDGLDSWIRESGLQGRIALPITPLR